MSRYAENTQVPTDQSGEAAKPGSSLAIKPAKPQTARGRHAFFCTQAEQCSAPPAQPAMAAEDGRFA